MTVIVDHDDDTSITALRSAQQKAVALELFARGVTVVLGLAPVVYGSLTFVYGDALWGGLPVYGTANKVPLAPQSWGTVAIIAGLLLVLAPTHRVRPVMMGAAVTMSLWASFFAMGFIIDAWQTHRPTGYAGAVFYLGVSAVYVMLARVAWVWRD